MGTKDSLFDKIGYFSFKAIGFGLSLTVLAGIIALDAIIIYSLINLF